MRKRPCVYIITNEWDGVLYTGVTSNLHQRIYQHKNHLIPGFSQRYNVVKLVYYEVCDEMRGAIMREKQIKGGSRAKKIALIRSMNPEWRDLSEEI